ncbi:MAG TPA: recombination protein NinB [Alphaproteobacteria bacterium]|nr:recombination protein NinB [Alphaproteobacteria bacterium]
MMFFILQDEMRRGNCLEYIRRIDLRRAHSVEIKQHRKNRSVAQNRLYWMWVNTLAETLGYEPDELHDHLKVRFIGVKEVTVFGKAVSIPKSTTSLSTAAFTEYLNKVEALARELKVILPYPDDLSYAMNG